MSTYQRFKDAAGQITADAIAEFSAETGLTYLGHNGPVYLLGSIRVRGTFIDQLGRHWADGHLVAESMTAGRNSDREAYTDLSERACDGIEGHGLLVVTPERGLVDATITPIATIATQLNLPAPELFPDGWARSWNSFPWIAEDDYRHLIAAGHIGDGQGGGDRG